MVLVQNYLFQILFSVGVIIVFGLIIAALNRAWCRMLGSKGVFAMRATGVIGTPVHEIGHAIFCLIFGHKVNGIKLYSMDTSTGVLGYVNHSYNKKNVYQQIGNFFIGVGPIIFGSIVLTVLMLIMVPATFQKVFASLGGINNLELGVFSEETYYGMITVFIKIFTAIFSFENIKNWIWWIFIIISMSIATHMSLSKADVKGSILGFFVLLVLMFIVDGIIFLISPNILIAMTSAMIKGSFYIISLLAIAVILLLILLLFTFIFGGFKTKRNT